MKNNYFIGIIASVVLGLTAMFAMQSCEKEVKEVYIYQNIVDKLQGRWKSDIVTTEEDGCINMTISGNSIDIEVPENYTDPYYGLYNGSFVFEIINDSVMGFGSNKTDLRPRLYHVGSSTFIFSGRFFYKQ